MIKNSISENKDFLIAEFNYAAQTAFQAQEDRSRVSEFFIISIGSIVIALLSSQVLNIENNVLIKILLLIFGVVYIFGIFTILHLSRLRLAWFESLKAMNKIKDEIIRTNPDLTSSFRWQSNTIPKLIRPWSVGFLLVLEISLITSVFGSLIVYLQFFTNVQNISWGNILLSISIIWIANTVIFYILPLCFAKQKI